jgi:hypothetical protein
MINPRGSIPVNYMLPNETGVQNVNAQATTIAAAGVDLKGLTTDTAALPAEDQRPIIENAQGVKDYTNVRSNPTVLNGLKLTSQDRPANYVSRTVTQDGFRRQNQSRRFQIK